MYKRQEYPRLVLTRNRAESDEELSGEEEDETAAAAESQEPASETVAPSVTISDAAELASDEPEGDQGEDPLAGIDLDTVTLDEDVQHPKSAGDSVSDYLDDQASEQTASPWLHRPDASGEQAPPEPETIELTLLDEDELDAAVDFGDEEDTSETLKPQADTVDAPAEEPSESEDTTDEPADIAEKKKPSSMFEDSTLWP